VSGKGEREQAVSLHFKKFSRHPGVIVDSRSDKEFPASDAATWVLIYEDRVEGWFFRYIEELTKQHDAGFVVLQLTLGQIEGIEQYRKGRSSRDASEEFISSGLRRMFCLGNRYNSRLRHFYYDVRCGLFHDGITRPGVCIENRSPQALEITPTEIWISPNKLFKAVRKDFRDYIALLKNAKETTLRENFEAHWKRTDIR
jgi:hypothetical protein